MEDLQNKFNKAWAAYQSIGWTICRSGAMYYIKDNRGTIVIKQYSHKSRMKSFLDFIR